jgi:hypothetical protein
MPMPKPKARATFDPGRLARATACRGLTATAAMLLSLGACAALVALIVSPSSLCVASALGETPWKGVAVLFALLATAAVGLGFTVAALVDRHMPTGVERPDPCGR